MNGSVVENILTVSYSQKARALLIRLGAEFCNFEKLLSRREFSVFFAVSYYVVRDSGVKTGNPRKERRTCRVKVHADAVYAIFKNAVENFVEPSRRHIVLILSHAYRLRIDFYKFRQRVL